MTVGFVKVSIKGEGILSVVLSCCHPRRPPHLWIADQVRNDVTVHYMACTPRCGYCLEASMTAARSVRPVGLTSL